MTNRKLPEITEDEIKVIDVNDMGVVLGEIGDQGDRVYSGLLTDDNTQIEFYGKGLVDKLFSEISDEELKKPWVFFLHGFNQEPDENIAKARALHDNHNVNVINFAWPSKPINQQYKLNQAKKDILMGVIKGMPFNALATGFVYKLVKGYLKDVWNNYEPAIKNAEESDNDLLIAIKLVANKINLSAPPVLLVHSMGNYLVENIIKKHDSLNATFNNIVLHQADVNCPGYEWVLKLKRSLANRETGTATSRLYITSNAPDFVLAGSCARRFILNIKPAERLGQNQLHYLNDNVFYLDFTSAPGVDDNHEIFKQKRANDYEETDLSGLIDGSVFDCLGRIFRAEDDKLPMANKEVKSGFMKMPTDTLLYRLNELIHPADSYHPPEEELVSPLDLFVELGAPEIMMEDDYI